MAITGVLVFMVGQFVVCTTALGSLMSMTGAEQQVCAGTGYSIDEVQYDDPVHFYPEAPQGLGDAHLYLPLSNYGVSISTSLDSSFTMVNPLFLEDQIGADGSVVASAEWGTQDPDVDDVHGGGGSRFTLSFARDSSPAYFYVKGKIDVAIADDGSNPEEMYAYMRLSSGGTTLWADWVDGTSLSWSWMVAHGVWLETGKTYLLEAYAEAGVGSTGSMASQSNLASFSFTATATGVNIDIVPDTVTTKAKTITCKIWPPSGYDVTQIDEGSIRLNGTIAPYGRAVYRKGTTPQYSLFTFPTSGMFTEPSPNPVPLNVSGQLDDGTPFAGTDYVILVKKGRK